jgi:allantoate deiminase
MRFLFPLMSRMVTLKRAFAAEDRAVSIREDSAGLAKLAIERCLKLATFTERPGTITRTFLSPPMRDCHQELAEWLEPLGAAVRIDAAGNFRALYPSSEEVAPRLLIGSHLDTVPDGGAFDGILGVVIGVTLLEALRGERLPFSIELVGFSEEEGVRFGLPFIGSRALIGALDDAFLDHCDAHGISIRRAIADFGLDARELPRTGLADDVFGYLEFHIEQGPVLEELALPLAAVDAIVGQTRLEIEFTGSANHAGTTPMRSRRDALAGAAEWITAVEHEGRKTPGLVTTVGAVNVMPGATNVIASEARLSLDVRHRDDLIRTQAVERLVREAKNIASHRRLGVRYSTLLEQPATRLDEALIEQIEKAIREAGCESHRITSGAGHDAMILAQRVPSAMIFLRTSGGISHSPEETVLIEDVAKAIETGSHLLAELAASKTSKARART